MYSFCFISFTPTSYEPPIIRNVCESLIDRTVSFKKLSSNMKKLIHTFHLDQIHLGENTKVALLAIGFLSFVMFISYLYWFA